MLLLMVVVVVAGLLFARGDVDAVVAAETGVVLRSAQGVVQQNGAGRVPYHGHGAGEIGAFWRTDEFRVHLVGGGHRASHGVRVFR